MMTRLSQGRTRQLQIPAGVPRDTRQQVEQYFEAELKALADNNEPNYDKLSGLRLTQLKAINRTGKTLIHHWAQTKGLSNITC